MKKCSKCKQEKHVNDFYRSIDKVQSYCIECTKDRKNNNYKTKDEWITLFCGEGSWMRCYFYE